MMFNQQKMEADDETEEFRNNSKQNLSSCFAEYSLNTGIYGMKYLGDKKRTLVEKCFWLTVISGFFFICTILIIQTWLGWNQTPVFVNYAQRPTPTWQVPFPAITICSETKVRQTIYNFTDHYHKMINEGDTLSPEELQQFSDISLLCDNHVYRFGNKTSTHKIIDQLTDVAPSFSEVFFSCKWKNSNSTCDSLFSPILTEDGMCFTFNMLDREELFTEVAYFKGDFFKRDQISEGWSLDEGYPKTAKKDTFPRRVISTGSKAGMFVLLKAYEQDLDYICRGPVQGFKVLLHHPAEVPKIESLYFRAPLNQEVIVAVTPHLTTTSSNLKNYDPRQRECFFSQERQLKFFRFYTEENCRVECRSNYTLTKCGCVAYHMPHEKTTPLCGSGSNTCVFEAEQEMLYLEVESKMSSFNYEDEDFSPLGCDCLPSCTSLKYTAEVSQADFNWAKVFEAFKVNKNEFPGIQMTRLTIFFKDYQFISSERNELVFTRTEFLAACGGLVALFTGFSFFSVVEIIYFCCRRLKWNLQKNSTHTLPGSSNSLSRQDESND